MKPDHTIEIKVQHGEIECKEKHAKHAEKIQWVLKGGDQFAVEFGNNSPFEKHNIQGTDESYPEPVLAQPISEPQEFKYIVAVLAKGSILILDPTIIIDP